MRLCPSYPGYSITKSGDVFSHRRRFGKGKGNGGGVVIDPDYSRKMNPFFGHGRYVYVSISTKRGQRVIPVHLLLLDAFVGPRPAGQETRHLDGNPENNSLDNICYGTRKMNSEDRVRHGRQRGREILNRIQVVNIRSLREQGVAVTAIAKRHSISETCARDVINQRTYVNVK